jgi:hypothetical protein
MILLTKIRYLGSFSVLNLFFISVLVLVILNSCISLQPLDIQISKKEPFPLPENIQSIAILNRAMHSGFTNQTSDSLEKSLFGEGGINSVFRDSLAADTAIRVAAKALYESGRYDVVVPINRNILRIDSSPLAEQLPSSFTDGICSDFHTNAVLVLERFEAHLVASCNLSRFDNEIPVKAPGGKYQDSTGDIYIHYNSVWRIYTLCDSCDIKQYNISDYRYWGGDYFNLPYLKDALIENGTAAGLKLSQNISPEWENAYREYFITHNKEIDAAIPLIKNNKWEEAAVIWLKYSTIPSKSIRSKVEFNLALASEMNGDLNLAMEWCGKSIKTVYSDDKKAYLSALELRKKESEKDAGKKTF